MSSAEDPKLPENEPASRHCEGPLRDWCGVAEDCARREPAKCAAIAFLAGFLFTILPVGQILGALLRLALGLIRPVLIVLGAMKVFEEVEKRKQG